MIGTPNYQTETNSGTCIYFEMFVEVGNNMSKITSFILRAKGFYTRYKKELRFFYKFAIPAKLHFIKYKSRKVILFRLDLIGDCTMFTSAARAIRDYYKDREMTIVCLTASRHVFERLGIFDKIITVNFKPEAVNWSIVKDIVSQIRECTYDILLQPQISKFPIADILAAAVKCNQRIEIEPMHENGNSTPRWLKLTDLLYDRKIPYPRGFVSEFDYYGAFIRGVCDPNYKTTMPQLPYKEQHFIIGNYYVMYPGGSLIQKYWSLDRYALVANHIYEKTGLTCVILGSEEEHWAADDLKNHLNIKVYPSVIDLMGKTTIEDVIDIIGNAKFVVSNDTSGVHIAAATNTPSVAIAGGWHFRRFLPYSIEQIESSDKIPLVAYTEMQCYNCGWNWAIVKEKNPECLKLLQENLPSACMPAVSSKQVIELVDKILLEENLC